MPFYRVDEYRKHAAITHVHPIMHLSFASNRKVVAERSVCDPPHYHTNHE